MLHTMVGMHAATGPRPSQYYFIKCFHIAGKVLQTEILTSKYPHSCPSGNPFTVSLDRNTVQAGLHKDDFFKPSCAGIYP